MPSSRPVVLALLHEGVGDLQLDIPGKKDGPVVGMKRGNRGEKKEQQKGYRQEPVQ